MASRVVWDGLDELVAEIKALPEACTGEAAKRVEGAANGAKVEIAAAYPWRTGDLQKKTTVTPVIRKGLTVGARVKNTSKVAQIVENGTQARHYVTVNGKTHLTGRMPPLHVFVPRIVRARRRLTQALKDMVARHGAKVTGEA
jgi:acetylornithine/succinyldiaminopimelate/putrescine aminotransferase